MCFSDWFPMNMSVTGGTGLVTIESLLGCVHSVESPGPPHCWQHLPPLAPGPSPKSQMLPAQSGRQLAQRWLWRESRLSPNRSRHLVALVCLQGPQSGFMSSVSLFPIQPSPKTAVWPGLPLSRLGPCPILSSPRRASHLAFPATHPLQLAEDGHLCLPRVLWPGTLTTYCSFRLMFSGSIQLSLSLA